MIDALTYPSAGISSSRRRYISCRADARKTCSPLTRHRPRPSRAGREDKLLRVGTLRVRHPLEEALRRSLRVHFAPRPARVITARPRTSSRAEEELLGESEGWEAVMRLREATHCMRDRTMAGSESEEPEESARQRFTARQEAITTRRRRSRASSRTCCLRGSSRARRRQTGKHRRPTKKFRRLGLQPHYHRRLFRLRFSRGRHRERGRVGSSSSTMTTKITAGEGVERGGIKCSGIGSKKN